ncbi:MAG: divergent polysaccharide deacetylase family protein [Alphaproteobacteria bacterium]|nr:divergent polysaccharide deacetylase family protein [Alphaproteobacteria bacterium]
MTDTAFKDQLDEELQKRSYGAESSQEKKEERPRKSKPSLFSFAAFLKGILLGILVLAGLAAWSWFQAPQTIQEMVERLPSKTAIVQKDDQNIYRITEVQPVLQMSNLSNQIAEGEQKPTMPGALVAAPIPGLYESTADGILPLPRHEDGLTPFEAYKRPFTRAGEKPVLSIVISGLGVSKRITESVIDNFPPEISLVFSPYPRELKLFTDLARQKGHEVWLTLPMETADYPAYDPGPSTLLLNASVEKNQSRLVDLLSSTAGYAGFVSQKGHVFTPEDAGVNPAIQQVFSRGLAVIDSNTNTRLHFASKLARMNDYPVIKNQMWLDVDPDPASIRQRLSSSLEFARASGGSVVMVHPYPASLKEIQKFLNSPAAQEFQLAPVSAFARYE